MPAIPLPFDLVEERRSRIFGYVYSRHRNKEAAETIATNACNAADKSWPRKDPTGTKPFEELIRYTIAIAKNLLTKNRLNSALVGSESDKPVNVDLALDLEHCIGKLDPNDAKIVQWHDIDKSTWEEIAQELNISPSVVHGRYKAAIKQLRQCLIAHRPIPRKIRANPK